MRLLDGRNVATRQAVHGERTIDTKLLIYGLFQKSRVLAQDEVLVANNAFFLQNVIASMNRRRKRAEVPPRRRRIRRISLLWLSGRRYAIFFFTDHGCLEIVVALC